MNNEINFNFIEQIMLNIFAVTIGFLKTIKIDLMSTVVKSILTNLILVEVCVSYSL